MLLQISSQAPTISWWIGLDSNLLPMLSLNQLKKPKKPPQPLAFLGSA